MTKQELVSFTHNVITFGTKVQSSIAPNQELNSAIVYLKHQLQSDDSTDIKIGLDVIIINIDKVDYRLSAINDDYIDYIGNNSNANSIINFATVFLHNAPHDYSNDIKKAQHHIKGSVWHLLEDIDLARMDYLALQRKIEDWDDSIKSKLIS